MIKVCQTCFSPLSKLSGTCLNIECSSNTPDPYTTKMLGNDTHGIKRCNLCDDMLSDLKGGCINPKCSQNVNVDDYEIEESTFTPDLTPEKVTKPKPKVKKVTIKQKKYPIADKSNIDSRSISQKLVDEAPDSIVEPLIGSGIIDFDEIETSITTKINIDEGVESILKIKTQNESREDFIFNLFREQFSSMHYGDIPIIDSLLISTALQSCINTAGIQPTISGDMGSGKSSGISSALHLMPPEFLLKTSLSAKALFYHNVPAGTTIFSDDSILQSDLLEIIKKCTSDFQNKQMHMTIGSDKKGKRLAETHFTSERLVFIFTSIVDVGDDQLSSRQYSIPTDDNKITEEGYRRFLSTKNLEGRSDYPINENVNLCRNIVREIKKHLFRVTIPFLVKYSSSASRRHMNQFYDFIRAISIIRYMKHDRRITEGDVENIITLDATKEDFEFARLIFCKNIKMQLSKMTGSEEKTCDWIVKKFETLPSVIETGINETNLTNLWVEDGMGSRTQFKRSLHGEKKNGEQHGGIIYKSNSIYITKDRVTISNNDKSKQSSRECNIVFCNKNKPQPNLNSTFENFVWLE